MADASEFVVGSVWCYKDMYVFVVVGPRRFLCLDDSFDDSFDVHGAPTPDDTGHVYPLLQSSVLLKSVRIT